ncbi:hypothetical protein PENTCL1PPCAC_15123, partial [Pristionchus entomophagus]
HGPSQRRRCGFHAGDEKVRACCEQVNLTEVRVLSHLLFVGVSEACRFVLDVVVLQGALDVLDDELVELLLCCSNSADRVPADDRPVSDCGEHQGQHHADRLAHLLHQLNESVHVIHQRLAIIVRVAEAEQNLVDDVGNHDL